jgi:hypothetical protein
MVAKRDKSPEMHITKRVDPKARGTAHSRPFDSGATTNLIERLKQRESDDGKRVSVLGREMTSLTSS